MKIEYQELNMGDVLRYFVGGYELKPGDAIAKYDWFYDATKGKVILKLYLKDGQSENKS